MIVTLVWTVVAIINIGCVLDLLLFIRCLDRNYKRATETRTLLAPSPRYAKWPFGGIVWWLRTR